MTSGGTPLGHDELAALVARDIPVGSFVNLGIGLPTKVSNHLRADQRVLLHTENGMLGMGPEAHGADVDPDLINAGKVPVTELPGASYFHHADSFAMMRGGTSTSACSAPTRSRRVATWPTGTPASPTTSRPSAARWTSRSARSRPS